MFMVYSPVCTYSEELSKNIYANSTPDQLNPDLCVRFLGNFYFEEFLCDYNVHPRLALLRMILRDMVEKSMVSWSIGRQEG